MVGALAVADHQDIEDVLIDAFEVPAEARSVSVSLDRVSVPMEEPWPRPVGRPRKGAPKRPVARAFRMAYCGTVTLHDAVSAAGTARPTAEPTPAATASPAPAATPTETAAEAITTAPAAHPVSYIARLEPDPDRGARQHPNAHPVIVVSRQRYPQLVDERRAVVPDGDVEPAPHGPGQTPRTHLTRPHQLDLPQPLLGVDTSPSLGTTAAAPGAPESAAPAAPTIPTIERPRRHRESNAVPLVPPPGSNHAVNPAAIACRPTGPPLMRLTQRNSASLSSPTETSSSSKYVMKPVHPLLIPSTSIGSGVQTLVNSIA